MATKKYSIDEIFEKLGKIDVLISLGRSVTDALQSIGVPPTSYYRWRSEYGGVTRTLRSSRGPSSTKH
jgi:putative transposase